MSAPTRPAAPATRQAAVLLRLEEAFAMLRRFGVAALPAFGSDPVAVRGQLATALRARWPYGTGEYAFYTATDAAGCFDDAGELLSPLTVHHHPAARSVVGLALDEAGVSFSARGDDTIVVTLG